jgi:hypothetical protein
MRTELRVKDHSVLPDTKIIEIWYAGAFIGTVTPADGPGVRIVSKYLTNSGDAIFIVLEPVPVLEVRLQP